MHMCMCASARACAPSSATSLKSTGLPQRRELHLGSGERHGAGEGGPAPFGLVDELDALVWQQELQPVYVNAWACIFGLFRCTLTFSHAALRTSPRTPS